MATTNSGRTRVVLASSGGPDTAVPVRLLSDGYAVVACPVDGGEARAPVTGAAPGGAR